MLAIAKRVALATLMVSIPVPSLVLGADEVVCQSPPPPQLSAAIVDDAHARYLSDLVESTLSSGVENLKCIQGALEENDLTDAERQQLEKAYEAQVSAMRAIADRWNGLYTSHARRKTGK